MGTSKRVNASRSGGMAGVQDLGVDAEVERAKEMLQKPLCKFLRTRSCTGPTSCQLGSRHEPLGDVPDAVDSGHRRRRRRSGWGGSPAPRHQEGVSRHRGGQAVAADIKSNPEVRGRRIGALLVGVEPDEAALDGLRLAPAFRFPVDEALPGAVLQPGTRRRGGHGDCALCSQVISVVSEAVRILEQVEAAFNSTRPSTLSLRVHPRRSRRPTPSTTSCLTSTSRSWTGIRLRRPIGTPWRLSLP